MGASLDDLTDMSDEELILYARNKIANTKSSAGAASHNPNAGRAWNEPEIGLRILDGTLDKGTIEEFVRSGDFTILTNKRC